MTEEKNQGAAAAAEGAEQVGVAAAAESAAGQAPAAEPSALELPKRRQWVTLRGSSMDLRVGVGLASGCAHDLASAVGRPRACALAAEQGAPADVVEELRRGLTDQGFLVHPCGLPAGEEAHGFSALEAFYAQLARAEVTADDLVVAVGGEASLSLAAAGCAHWCSQTMAALFPTDFASAVTCGVTPRALDVAGLPRMVAHDGTARFELCDLGVLEAHSAPDDVLLARAHMVAAAMADSDKAFGKLWDAADDIVSGDAAAGADALVECIRSKGKVASSSSVAIRQSVEYGQALRHALRAVVPADVPESVLLAEALRFSARLSVAREELSLDDMFTQDELLERLGLGSVECAVDADALLAAIKKERFSHTNRFMLALPRAIGRVRLASVEADALAEHVAAWCASR